MKKKYKTIKELARKLRKNPTNAEKKLWKILRKRKLDGFKFLRQHPIIYEQRQNKINFFIADFYCAEKKLVVELDGKVHHYQKHYDQQRDLILKEKDLNVLRIKNKYLENIETVKQRILNFL